MHRSVLHQGKNTKERVSLVDLQVFVEHGWRGSVN